MLLEAISSNKAVGFDNNLSKLVKLAAEILATPHSHIINNSILKGVF